MPPNRSILILSCVAILTVACGPRTDGGTSAMDQPLGPAAPAQEPLVVLAAVSLADVLPAVAADIRARGGPDATFVFDASSRLARQVEAGLRADLFISADASWVDHLNGKGLIAPQTRVDLAGGALVVVVPSATTDPPQGPTDLRAPRWWPLALAAEGVPAGRYAEAALRSTGVWTAVEADVVRAEHARAVLRWVRGGEAPAGIVYATDARSEPGTRIAFTFDPQTHPPIRYAGTVLRAAVDGSAAERWLRMAGDEGSKRRWEEWGFGG